MKDQLIDTADDDNQLILSKTNSDVNNNNDYYNDDDIKQHKFFISKEEIREWLKIAIPTVLTNFIRLATNFTDLSFLGHLKVDINFPDAKSYDFLAATSYSLIWTNTIGIMLFTGLPDAFQTLASQAKGQNNNVMVRVWLRICIVVTVIALIPISMLFLLTGDIIQLIFGQSNCNQQCYSLVNQFSYYWIIQLFPAAMNVLIYKYFQIHKIIWPFMIINMIFSILNYFLNHLLIYNAGLGYKGSPIATAITRYSIFFTSLILIQFYYKQKLNSNKNREEEEEIRSKVNLKEKYIIYVKQGLIMSLSNFMEVLQFQSIAIMAGSMGGKEIAMNVGQLNMMFTMTCIQFGLQNATTIRMCHFIGQKRVQIAKKLTKFSLGVGLTISLIICILFLSLKNQLSYLYSDDSEINQMSRPLNILAGFGMLFLTLFFAAMGILQAQTRAKYAAIAYFIGGYLITIPLAYLLGIHFHYQVFGLHLSLSIGYFCMTSITCYFVYIADWNDVLKRTQQMQQLRQIQIQKIQS